MENIAHDGIEPEEEPLAKEADLDEEFETEGIPGVNDDDEPTPAIIDERMFNDDDPSDYVESPPQDKN